MITYARLLKGAQTNRSLATRKDYMTISSTTISRFPLSETTRYKNEGKISSRAVETNSSFFETAGRYAVNTAAITTAIALPALAIANGMGVFSTSGQDTYAQGPTDLGFMSGSSGGRDFFPNSTHFNHTTISHAISVPSSLELSTTCVHNVALATFGLLFAQNTWSLDGFRNLFGSCTPSKSKANTDPQLILSTPCIIPRAASHKSEKPNPLTSDIPMCAMGLLSLATGQITIQLAGLPLLTYCLNVPGVKANLLEAFPATLSLANLNGANGFNITGINPGDNSGGSVSSAGDVNADGIADLIIGASGANNAAGASYVVFGSKQLGGQGTLSLAALNGANGFNITGINPNDYSGWSVSSAGDVNADGVADLIIGAGLPSYAAGASYVVFGSKQLGSQGTLTLADLNGTNGFNITGINPNDYSGWSVSSAGDVNADGIADLIIGEDRANNGAGASYVVFGSKQLGSQGTLTPADLNGTNGFNITGIKPGDESGISVSSAGDVNADGVADLIIGAAGPNNGAGASYVVFGSKQLGSQGTLTLADLNGTNGFNITGIKPNDDSGWSVSSAGDVNADGVADLIIGAFGANNGAGASYVVFGSKQLGRQGTLRLADLNGTNGFNITGINPSDDSGGSVSSAGDVNADGVADLIIGAFGANNGAGASYVVFGSKQLGSQGTLRLDALNGTNGFNITGINPTGINPGDESGGSVRSAGDVNADGVADLIIGAAGANNGAGASYVVFGHRYTTPAPASTLAPMTEAGSTSTALSTTTTGPASSSTAQSTITTSSGSSATALSTTTTASGANSNSAPANNNAAIIGGAAGGGVVVTGSLIGGLLYWLKNKKKQAVDPEVDSTRASMHFVVAPGTDYKPFNELQDGQKSPRTAVGDEQA